MENRILAFLPDDGSDKAENERARYDNVFLNNLFQWELINYYEWSKCLRRILARISPNKEC